ncbi:Resistance-Nodulation-Cell Division Superfamily transporter [Sulfurimonas denitrificans DSM 1251]|uniref:Resistance-Nodulation-Cell Division Superfamily transporter n=1 Tax=Sulfurimonas denitrificans (strain ATCC 33889 / DSM 1251) TaxID=326298 RepID=Q30TY0_SULDN|nr:efflux RND transporter permease subunit [Sulfurimonas denitrificans]ABB43551.1 Resistance-Nodulation-Cell Division Superfamily transporter [Sulfurimonas denitrificans DSM 1251]MDD3443480.1 efflux RND transporter permease subunit [Sulfurimonas denitrificans]
MFERVLKFFIENYKINYTLFFLLFAAGIYAYSQIPKEISPSIEPNSVTIHGSYAGASVDILNKMAVQEIEDEVKNIVGVDSVTSVVSPGRFTIVLEFDKRVDKATIIRDAEDAIALIKPNLPSDMDDPVIRGVAHSRSIMHVSIISSKISRDKLKLLSKKLKSNLLSVKDISDVTIFGDSDLFYEVLIDEKKVNAYNLSLDEILRVFSELSYIFPLGKIDNVKEQYYISTQNDKKLSCELENTIININDQQIVLKDIAKIEKKYEDSSTLASMNGEDSITLAISQNPKGDAIRIADDVKKLISEMSVDDVDFNIRMDNSIVIRDRLNIVISNILFGLILITLLTAVLINIRIALIIALGIPTSFVMGAIYFYFTAYSINVNSLIGVLIAIGILVDDAIVVSENIQQYIEKGYSAKEAALLGTQEVAKAVTIASLTTLFSFIPLLMLSGKLGEIIQLIPIAFSALVIASLIESFIFLPIHAAHTLSSNSKTMSWEKINLLYLRALKKLVGYQKSFLLIFLIIVPALIYYGVKHSKFQMFQPFDTSSINITFKAKPTTTLEQSLEIVQTLEKNILKEKDRFFVKHVSSTAGYRRSATGTTEIYPYVGYISIELHNMKPENFVDKYITPYLSFYYDSKDRIRDKSSQDISKDIREWLKEQDYQERFNLNNLMVVENSMGQTKADIRIGVISDDYKKALSAIREIEDGFSKIDGIKYFGDDVKVGTQEIKLKLNSYAEELGITEKYLGTYISGLFLSRKVGTIFDGKELLDIKVKSFYIKDDLESFAELEIPIKNRGHVKLKDICEFEKVESLENLVKDDGETNFYVFANVDPSIITATEVLQMMNPLIDKLKNTQDIRLKFKGEKEQKETMQTEMILASILAIILIFISILYLFNSLRETLIVMSVIPFSILGVYIGHFIMGLNISLPSLIGALGLAGVIVNDGILMMATIKRAKTKEEIFILAPKRFRPIILTSVTTIVGLCSLIFFATAEAVTFQPLAVAMGFGLLWGTILNLFYLPVTYNFLHGYKNYNKRSKIFKTFE